MPRYAYGWTPSPPDHRDVMYAAPAHLMAAELPRVVSLRSKFAMEPFNQGALGSCGPNSAAGDIVIAQGNDGLTQIKTPSRQFIYWVTRSLMGTVNEDSGVNNRAMLKALNQYGWCDEELCPYQINRFTVRPSEQAFSQAVARRIVAYLRVQQDLQTMKACLAGGDPFIYGFSVYASFESPQTSNTGVVPMPTAGEKLLGGHDVLIIGYDDVREAFEFRNSYGVEWGDGGHGWMPYRYATNANLSSDFWTVQKSAMPVPAPPSPVPIPAPGPVDGWPNFTELTLWTADRKEVVRFKRA